MSPRLHRLLLTATAAAGLAGALPAAAAHAGEPVTIGEGKSPHVVVDATTGMARAVWLDDDANRIRFCAVPRGATACSHTAELLPPSGGPPVVGVPFLLDGGPGGIDKIVTAVGGKLYAYTSGDGLTGWTPGTKYYDVAPGTNHRAPVLNADGSEFLMAGTNPALSVWAVRSNSTDTTASATASLPTGATSGLVYDLEVAHAGGSTYLATANDLQRTYVWAATGAGDLSTEGAWSAAPTLVGDSDTSRLAGNATGAYLMTSGGTPSQPTVEVRRWNAAALAFGAPAVVAAETGYINDVDVAASGTVVTVWRKNDAPTNRLRFARSADGGATWATSTIARDDAIMADMDVAVAGDGEGFAVYEGRSIDGNTREIRLASTTALPEPPPAPPAPPTGGSGSGGGASGGAKTTVTVKPNPILTAIGGGTKPAKKVKLTTATVPGATISLGVPTACIPAGKPFTATLSFTKQRKKGNVFVKVRRTDFSIGGRILKKDTSAPFTQTLTIPRPKKGQTYTLKARAHIKVKRGAGPKKSISATLKVCA